MYPSEYWGKQFSKEEFRKTGIGGLQRVIAVFPEDFSDCVPWYYCNSYMHIGQHGSCFPAAMNELTIPALPEEYEELEKELLSYGYYQLTVRQKIGNYHDIRRKKFEEWNKFLKNQSSSSA